MPIIHRTWECPCADCIFYTKWKTFPNPNATAEHYCEKRRIRITRNINHASGWYIPCGWRDKEIKDER